MKNENNEPTFTIINDEQTSPTPPINKNEQRKRIIGYGALFVLLIGSIALFVRNNQLQSLSEASEPLAQIAAEDLPTLSQPQASAITTFNALNETSAPALNEFSSVFQAASEANIASVVGVASETPAPIETNETKVIAPKINEDTIKAREAQEKQKQEQEIAQAVQNARIAQNNDNLARQNNRSNNTAAKSNEQNNVTSSPKQAKAAKPTQPLNTKTQRPSSGHFVVQVGAFGTKANADKAAQKLRDLGLNASINPVKSSKGTLYRVQATGFTSRESAQNAAAKMKNNGLNSMIIGK